MKLKIVPAFATILIGSLSVTPWVEAELPPPLPGASSSQKVWYTGQGGTKNGPFAPAEMASKIREGSMTAEILVWKEGMIGWEKAGDVSGLAGYFAPPPPPPPPPPNDPVDDDNVESKHPIDAAMDAAMERNGSTAGEVEAIDAALVRWDRLLNDKYVELKGRLDGDGQERLRDSQRAWMEWRDREIEARRAIFGNFRGTMYVPMRAYSAMNVTRERALYLERMADLVKQGG